MISFSLKGTFRLLRMQISFFEGGCSAGTAAASAGKFIRFWSAKSPAKACTRNGHPLKRCARCMKPWQPAIRRMLLTNWGIPTIHQPTLMNCGNSSRYAASGGWVYWACHRPLRITLRLSPLRLQKSTVDRKFVGKNSDNLCSPSYFKIDSF